MKTIACFASSLDGKIASAPDPENRIGSHEDLQHLLRVRSQGDAILVGGETFRQFPRFRRGADPAHTPLQCILTRSFRLPPDAPLFTRAEADPIVVYAPYPPAEADQKRYPAHVEWVSLPQQDWVGAIKRHLQTKGVKTLMVEGGGQVFYEFLAAKAVDELYLTLCPLFLAGGEQASGLVSGPGFRVPQAPRTEILDQWHVGQEIYLRLGIHYPQT